MPDQAKNLLIGVFVAASFALVTFMLLFLHPTVGNEGRVIKVRFSDVDKVNPGTRVTYGGRPVGEVTDIKEITDPTHPRQAKNGYVYLYEVTAVVDTSVRIYDTDIVGLKTAGLLGERSLAITPQPAIQGIPLREIDDEVIWADESGSFEEAIKDLRSLSKKIETTLDGITGTFDDIKQQKLVENLSNTFKNLSDITSALNNEAKITGILDNVHTMTANGIDAVKKADVFFTNADKLMIDTHRVVTNEEGTIGRLFLKDDLYLRLNAIFSKAEVLMNDINHYGLLFQTDKRWQRVRARRANLLYTLQTPQEFKNYFNDEMDQITTSLSRVNVVLEETGELECFNEMVDNGQFKKALAELIRRVKMMEESIQMYNTQYSELETFKTEICEE